MELAGVGARLASNAVMPLVKRLFVREGPGAGLTEPGKPVRISSLVTFRGERRSLTEKELRRLVRELVGRAADGAGPGVELDAVSDALVRTLHALGDIAMDDVQAVELGEAALRRELFAAAGGERLVAQLSEASEQLYGRVLDSACVHILHFFTQRSTFVARTLVEQSRRLGELIAQGDLLLERLTSRTSEDAAFEKRYAEYVRKKQNRVTIYGLDLQHQREWSLDTAYLNLEVTRRHEQAFPGEGHGQDFRTTESRRVDEALAAHERVLLRGVAGSGKTTLLQWLAVSATQEGGPPAELSHLVGMVPFVLPLRTLARGGELPLPEDYLRVVGCPLEPPPGWTSRVLAADRGLVLIDGIDEVTESQRELTRRWVCDLLTAFPGNRLLVTSRPSAVREEWLGSENFAELSLSAMRPKDVNVFVSRWHKAAGAEKNLEKALLTELRVKKDLGRLATNPLMCGLICALHRERRGFLPRGRKALYDAALSMLLERRDRERNVGALDGMELDEESQTELLQKLAYWLIRNGRAEMDEGDALAQLERVLPSMAHVQRQGDARQILRFLILRSGLLREPVEGAIDFVHRTFQDYLAARELVQERDFDLLVRHAHEDQWDDVVRMSVAHAHPRERARILRSLTERGDSDADKRARLHILAAACLEHATTVDPAVREEVTTRAGALFPPRDYHEAEALARVGPIAVDLLPGPENLNADEATATTEVLARVGTDSALARLTRFLDDPNPEVLMALGAQWQRFDTETYGREIITALANRTDTGVWVRSDEELTFLTGVPELTEVFLTEDFTAEQITRSLSPDLCTLGIYHNSAVRDLGFLSHFRKLSTLLLENCNNVQDCAPLGDLPLHTLMISTATAKGLRDLPRLSCLVLSGSVGVSSISDLPRLEFLQDLLLPASVRDLAGISRFTNLTSLNLTEIDDCPASHLREISELPLLQSLSVNLGEFHGLGALPQVRSLHLSCGGRTPQLEDLLARFPSLSEVELHAPKADTQLSPLTSLPRLTRLTVSEPAGDLDLTPLPATVEVTVHSRL